MSSPPKRSRYYDGANRVTEEKDALNHSRYFSYDHENNLIERTDRNGRVTQWDYDLFNNVTQERWMSGASPIHTIDYTYDAAGQLTAAEDSLSAYAFASSPAIRS